MQKIRRAVLVVVLGAFLVTSSDADVIGSFPPERDIGNGVAAKAARLPVDLRAAVVDAQVAGYDEVTRLSPVYDIQPSGALPAPTTITLPLSQRPDDDTAVLVATSESPDGPWTLIAATVTPDRGSVTFETTHLSFFSAVGASVRDMLATFKKEVLDGLTSSVTAEAEPPKCEGEEAVRAEGFRVSSDETDTVFWCLGLEDAKPVLKIVNNRRYALAVRHGGAEVLNPGRFDAMSMLTSDKSAGIEAREEIRLALALQPDQRAEFAVSFNGPARSITQLVTGVKGMVAVLSRFGLGGGVDWAKKVDDLLAIPSCAKAVNSSAGDVIAACFGPKELIEAFGFKGMMLGAFVVVGEFFEFFRGSVNALFDQFNGRSNYRIVVERDAPNTITLGALSLTLPADWKAEPLKSNAGVVSGYRVRTSPNCYTMPSEWGPVDDPSLCPGFQIRGHDLISDTTGVGPRPYEPGFRYHPGRGIAACITTKPTAELYESANETALENRLADVGSRKASFYSWRVPCAKPQLPVVVTDSFVQRDWWLPTSRILITDMWSTPRLDEVLARARWR